MARVGIWSGVMLEGGILALDEIVADAITPGGGTQVPLMDADDEHRVMRFDAGTRLLVEGRKVNWRNVARRRIVAYDVHVQESLA